MEEDIKNLLFEIRKFAIRGEDCLEERITDIAFDQFVNINRKIVAALESHGIEVPSRHLQRFPADWQD